MSIAKKRLVSFLERTSHSVKSGSFQNFQLTINQPNTTCSPVTLPKEEVQISSPFRRHIVPYTWVFCCFCFVLAKLLQVLVTQYSVMLPQFSGRQGEKNKGGLSWEHRKRVVCFRDHSFCLFYLHSPRSSAQSSIYKHLPILCFIPKETVEAIKG